MRAYDIFVALICFNIGFFLISCIVNFSSYQTMDVVGTFGWSVIFGLTALIFSYAVASYFGINPGLLAAVSFVGTFLVPWIKESLAILYDIAGDMDAGLSFPIATTALHIFVALESLFLAMGILQWGTGGWKQNE